MNECPDFRAGFDKRLHEVTPDETTRTRHQNAFSF
jgi:hypothetical protein